MSKALFCIHHNADQDPSDFIPIPRHFMDALMTQLSNTPYCGAPQLFLKGTNPKDLPWPEAIIDMTEKTVTYFCSLRECSIICRSKDFEKKYTKDANAWIGERLNALEKRAEETRDTLILRGAVEIDIPSHADKGENVELILSQGVSFIYSNLDNAVMNHKAMDAELTDFLHKVVTQREKEFKENTPPLTEGETEPYTQLDVFGGWIKVYTNPQTTSPPTISDGPFLPETTSKEWVAYILADNDAGGHIHVVKAEVYEALFATRSTHG